MRYCEPIAHALGRRALCHDYPEVCARRQNGVARFLTVALGRVAVAASWSATTRVASELRIAR